MKFPLDPVTYVETINQIVEHEKTQSLIIEKMTSLLEDILHDTKLEDGDTATEPWHYEATSLIKDIKALNKEHETRRFNEANYRAQNPEKGGSIIRALDDDFIASGEGEMSEEDLARHFKEKPKKAKKEKPKQLSEMSLDEIQSWEKAQENSNDIYKIKARVANLARGPGVSLTPQGEMLCNTYVHVLKALYDFAENVQDKNIKVQLTDLIRKQEGMPGNLIAAAGVGVKMKKDEKPKPEV